MHSKKVLPQDRYRMTGITTSTKRLVTNVEEYLGKLKQVPSDTTVNKLKNDFFKNESRNINYDIYGDTFDHYYFLTNFWKYFSHFKTCLRHNDAEVNLLDLGVGSGACVLAYLSIANEYDHKGMINLRLLDVSSKQLKKAINFIKFAKEDLKKLSIRITCEKKNLRTWQPTSNSYDLVLMGHVLTENQTHCENILENSVKAINPLGRIEIIERLDDKVNNVIENSLKDCLVSMDFYDHKVTKEVPFRYRAYTIKNLV